MAFGSKLSKDEISIVGLRITCFLMAFEGKRMSPAEQTYGVGEQELLAVIHALELRRCHLDGTEFTVATDHSPKTLFATKTLLSSRQTRWAERLSGFQFT